MAPDVSQFGRTAGDNRRSWGGKHLNETMDGEEARGGERNARADKVTEDMEFGHENLGGGREGEPQPSMGPE